MKKSTQIAKTTKNPLAKNPKRRRNFLGRGMGGAVSEYRDVVPFMMGGAIAGGIIGWMTRGSETTDHTLRKGSTAKGIVIGASAAGALGLGLVAWRHV